MHDTIITLTVRVTRAESRLGGPFSSPCCCAPSTMVLQEQRRAKPSLQKQRRGRWPWTCSQLDGESARQHNDHPTQRFNRGSLRTIPTQTLTQVTVAGLKC